jgi:hypothetical protein
MMRSQGLSRIQLLVGDRFQSMKPSGALALGGCLEAVKQFPEDEGNNSSVIPRELHSRRL